MSQFWHAHQFEVNYKPTQLQNWEVPRWHPEWPVKHCTTTKCIAHKNGRIYPNYKNATHKWSDFKGTWELPLKIDRATAEKLSKFTEYKKISWNNYEKKHKLICDKKSIHFTGPCKYNKPKQIKKQSILEEKSNDNKIIVESEDNTKTKVLNETNNNLNSKEKCEQIISCGI